MDLESVKRLVETDGGEYEFTVDSMPARFIEPIVMQGVKIDQIERGRIVCSYTVPARLVNADNSLHGGATAALVDILGSAVIFTVGATFTGVSVEINVTYMDGAYVGEELEIECKALKVGKALAVVSVNFRSKTTGKLIAQGRHSKYLAVHRHSAVDIKNLLCYTFKQLTKNFDIPGVSTSVSELFKQSIKEQGFRQLFRQLNRSATQTEELVEHGSLSRPNSLTNQ